MAKYLIPEDILFELLRDATRYSLLSACTDGGPGYEDYLEEYLEEISEEAGKTLHSISELTQHWLDTEYEQYKY